MLPSLSSITSRPVAPARWNTLKIPMLNLAITLPNDSRRCVIYLLLTPLSLHVDTPTLALPNSVSAYCGAGSTCCRAVLGSGQAEASKNKRQWLRVLRRPRGRRSLAVACRASKAAREVRRHGRREQPSEHNPRRETCCEIELKQTSSVDALQAQVLFLHAILGYQ